MKLVSPRNIFILILCVCVISAVIAVYLDSVAIQTEKRTGTANTLVIDPGHGGIDGGAISTDGTKESDINLGPEAARPCRIHRPKNGNDPGG